MKPFIFLFVILLSSNAIGAQTIDTLDNTLILRIEDNSSPIFSVNWSNIEVGQSTFSAKEKLGSFELSASKNTTLRGYKILSLTNEKVIWKNQEKEISLTILNTEEQQYRLKWSANFPVNHWAVPILRETNEQVYGGGIQYSNYLSYRRDIETISQENGIGRNGGHISKWTRMAGVAGHDAATYCPSNSVYTSAGRAFQWNKYAYSNLSCQNTRLLLEVWDTELNLTLTHKHQVKAQPMAYKLPSWSLGNIVGLQGGTDAVLQKLAVLQKAKAKIDAVWIQDWVGKQKTKYGSRLNWTWVLDETHYTNFDKFRDSLAKQGIKLLGYVNPYFAEKGKYTEEGKSKGYFLKDVNDVAVQHKFGGMNGYMLDLYDEEAYHWMKNIIKTNLIDNGFDGWMADFGEWYPIGNFNENLVEKIKLHNEFPVLWARLNNEVIKESGKELFFFNRSGGIGTSEYSSMMWAGDQMTDDTKEDGLLSVFDAYLSSAHSELPIIHSDAGGYTSVKKFGVKNIIRDEALLKDWLLLEAFTPVLRTHEGLLPEDNTQIYSNEKMAQYYAKLSHIHNALIPYFENLMAQRELDGTPIFKEVYQRFDELQKQIPALQVGNDIVILYCDKTRPLQALQDWYYINATLESVQGNAQEKGIVVGIRKSSELFNVVRN